MSRLIARTTKVFARLLLSGIFLVGGRDAFRHPTSKIAQAKAVTEPIESNLPFFPHDTALVVRLNGLFQIIAASALATGRWPRVAAVGLAGSLVPTTLAGHQFWNEAGDERFAQLTELLANAGVLGGLLLIAAGDGRLKAADCDPLDDAPSGQTCCPERKQHE